MQNELRESFDSRKRGIFTKNTFNSDTCLLCSNSKDVKVISSVEDKKGKWLIKSIEDPFPLVQPSSFKLLSEGIFKSYKAHGWSEIIADNRSHEKKFEDFAVDEITSFLVFLQERVRELSKKESVEYIVAYKANPCCFEHSHTHVFTLPIVPERIKSKIDSFEDYKIRKGKCIYCDFMKLSKNKIFENDHFASFVPFVSEFPFHVVILSKEHKPLFQNLSEAELFSLAEQLKLILTRYKALFSTPRYFISFIFKPMKAEDFHFHVEVGVLSYQDPLTLSFGFSHGITPESYVKLLRGGNERR